MLAVTTAFKIKGTKAKQPPPDLPPVTSLGVWQVGLYLQEAEGKGGLQVTSSREKLRELSPLIQGQFPAQASFPLF